MLTDRALFTLAATETVQFADAIAARYGIDPALVIEEPDPRRRAVRIAALLSTTVDRRPRR